MSPTYKKKTFANRLKGINFINFEPKRLLLSSTRLTYKDLILRSVQKGKSCLLPIKKIKDQDQIKEVAETRNDELVALNQMTQRNLLYRLQVDDTMTGLNISAEECILKSHKKITECQNKISHQLEEIKELERNNIISTQINNDLISDNIIESIKYLNIG